MLQKPLHSLGHVLRIRTNIAEEFDSRSDVLLGPGTRLRFLDGDVEEVDFRDAYRRPGDVEATLNGEQFLTSRQSFFNLVLTA